MKVYMQVTNDQYELPLAIADSVAELAKMTGHSQNTVASAISHGKKRKRSQWIKVIIEERIEPVGEFIKIPLTEEMKADLMECIAKMHSDAEKDCSTCSLNGGNHGCLETCEWCSDWEGEQNE